MKYTVIPEPRSFEIKGEEVVFEFCDTVSFEGTQETQASLDNLCEFLVEAFSFQPLGMGRGKIRLEISGQGESEGYKLKVERDRVILSGNDKNGLFYAVQTLKQLLICSDGRLPELEIVDSPRFSVRGFMLDCAKYFFTKEAVKQFLDMMALNKLNEFHWRLSDDQGFRCQIEKKLLLTEIGSFRSHTNFNSKPHEGYYTKEDMLEIIAYAHERCIRVIPEIESPCHVMGILSAYPELACFPRDFLTSSSFGDKQEVLCVGKESTFSFMGELYSELSRIFCDGIIHIGADDTVLKRWKSCPDCQKRMSQENLHDESELQAYYLQRIIKQLNDNGIEVRVRDGSFNKNLKGNVTWQLCYEKTDESDIAKEINDGKKVVVSDCRHYFLNLPYSVVSLESCYNFEPCFDGISKEGEKNILGVQACLFTDFISDMLTADKMTYPRLAAICESAWSQRDKKDYTFFKQKLSSYYELLLTLGVRGEKLKKAEAKGAVRLAQKELYKVKSKCMGSIYSKI